MSTNVALWLHGASLIFGSTMKVSTYNEYVHKTFGLLEKKGVLINKANETFAYAC